MDAGCSKHGCWYAGQGYTSCYESLTGSRCLLTGSATQQELDFGDEGEFIDAGTVSADSLSVTGMPTSNVLTGWVPLDRASFEAGLVAELQAEADGSPPGHPRYILDPASVVSGREFEISHVLDGTRILRMQESESQPCGVAHDGDVWWTPGMWPHAHLFHRGQWREVRDVRVEVNYPDPPVPVFLDVPEVVPSPVTVIIRGTWQ